MKQGKHLLLVLFSALASVALAGCAGATPTAGVTPTSAVNTPASPTATPVPSATQVETVAPTDTATATPLPATPTATPKPATNRAVVQSADGTVVFVDIDGKVTPIGKAPARLSSAPFAAALVSDTVYGFSFDASPGAYGISTTGTQSLDYVGKFLVGVAAEPGQTPADTQIAWGTYTTTDGVGISNILISKPDGSDLHVVLTDTSQAILFTLLPIHWAADGKTLYYSSEPTGLGGYIPFAGFSGLYTLDTASGVTTTLIERTSLGFICLDDLSADNNLVAYHCNDQAIHTLNLSTNQTTTIAIPTVLTDAASLGSTVISPDGSRVAFALSRRDPSNEQGWLAMSDGLLGASSLIYTSPAGSYPRVAGWLDANTIIFQVTPVSSNPGAPSTIWAINTDGSNPRQLAEGDLLMVTRAAAQSPTEQTGGLTWRQTTGDCQVAQFNQQNLLYGSCTGTLTSAGYAEPWSSAAFSHFIQTFAPFSAQTVAGSVIFTGTGQTIASPAEQRMIAEFARLAASEAAAGRGSAAGEAALSWHREGGFAGFCDDVTVTIYGAVSATTCHGEKPTALGAGWLMAAQAEQLYQWVDTLKSFQITHDKPTQPDELVITATFNGNGTTDASVADKQAITDFAQFQRTHIAQP